MLAKKGKEWEGKVRIIGLSIDNDTQTVKNHVNNKGWTSVEHYHVRTPGCQASELYGSSGVPHVLLIDTHGKIVFKGHPANRPNLEQDLDMLLQGEVITGAGTTAGAADSDEEETVYKDMSSNEVQGAQERFNQAATKLIGQSDVKQAAATTGRAFLVLVSEGKYDFASGKLQYSIQCITQIMGGGQACHTLKDLLDQSNKDSAWVNVDMVRPS